MFRPQSISSTDARKYFTKLINKVSFSSKSFVIESYRQPLVRIVNENYISVFEEVLGKKTVSQVMQIAGDERLLEAEKIEQIKKVFQRRLSGSPQSQPQPQKKQSVGAQRATPVAPKPQAQKPRPKDDRPMAEKPHPPQKSKNQNPRTSNPHPPLADPTPSNRGVLLLSNGKNYA